MKVGDRIELLEMPNDPAPIRVGTLGTVREVVDIGTRQRPLIQAWVDWDDGRALALCVPPDRVRVVE